MFKVAYCPEYVFDVTKGHKFPMEKYDLLPRQLLYEGTIHESQLFHPKILDRAIIEAVHSTPYLDRLFALQLSPREQRISGFVHTIALIQRERKIMSGTLEAALYALQDGIAMNIAGGTHHAYTDRGEGFCLLNDQAIAAEYLLQNKLAKKILILDLDVHQGNGTAEIFQENPNVFTFSMHGKDNYPLKKEISDLDIELSFQCKDAEYLKKLDSGLNEVMKNFSPDFVFYQSGVDILECDKLGKLSVTMEGLRQRDRMVLDLVKTHNWPIVASMGGGYSPDIKRIVEGHANLYRLAQNIYY